MLRPATPAEHRKRCCCKVPRVTEVLADVDCDVKLLLMTAPALRQESREYGLVTLSAHFGVSKRPTTKNYRQLFGLSPGCEQPELPSP